MISVRKYLERQSITQLDFARELQISGPHLNRLISGKSAPSVHLLQRMVAKTGLPADKLLREAASAGA